MKELLASLLNRTPAAPSPTPAELAAARATVRQKLARLRAEVKK